MKQLEKLNHQTIFMTAGNKMYIHFIFIFTKIVTNLQKVRKGTQVSLSGLRELSISLKSQRCIKILMVSAGYCLGNVLLQKDK